MSPFVSMCIPIPILYHYKNVLPSIHVVNPRRRTTLLVLKERHHSLAPVEVRASLAVRCVRAHREEDGVSPGARADIDGHIIAAYPGSRVVPVEAVRQPEVGARVWS